MTKEEAINALRIEGILFDGNAKRISEFFAGLDMAISDLRAQQEHESNEPLTLDELRQMEGEPVWTVGVSYTKDGTFSMWDIIESVDENGIQFGYSCEHPEWWAYGLKTTDGKRLLGWLAYRRKPNSRMPELQKEEPT